MFAISYEQLTHVDIELLEISLIVRRQVDELHTTLELVGQEINIFQVVFVVDGFLVGDDPAVVLHQTYMMTSQQHGTD